MKNTAIYEMVVLSLLMFFCGCSKSTGLNNNTITNPTDTTNSSPVISFVSSGTPTINSVYLEKISSDNDEIALSVKIKDGSDVYGAALWLTYDGNKIKYISASSSESYLGNDLFFQPALLNNNQGTLIIGIDKKPDSTGSNGDGTLLTIVFKALTIQSNTEISFNSTNCSLKSTSAEENVMGTIWLGGELSYAIE